MKLKEIKQFAQYPINRVVSDEELQQFFFEYYKSLPPRELKLNKKGCKYLVKYLHKKIKDKSL